MTNEEAAAEYYEAEQTNKCGETCLCRNCSHIDDPELELETRLDLAEIALMGIRAHLWKLDHRLNELIEWNNRNEQPKK